MKNNPEGLSDVISDKLHPEKKIERKIWGHVMNLVCP